MVDCPRTDIRDLLPDLVHDQLEPLARARVERHVVECAQCAAELALLRSMRTALSATPEVDVASIANAVLEASSNARRGRAEVVSDGGEVLPIERAAARPSRRPAWYAWRAAAGIAAVAVGVMGYELAAGPGRTAMQAREGTAVSSAPAPTSSSAAKAAAPPNYSAPAPTATADLAGSQPGIVVLGDGVSDLSESDMRKLLEAVDELEAMPDLEPYPIPTLGLVIEGVL